MTRRRRKGWDALPKRVQDFVDREAAKTRPLDECDPERITRLAVLLGIRPARIESDEAGGGS